MSVTGWLILMALAAFIVACALIVLYRTDPAKANAVVDTAEEVAEGAGKAATGLWARFKAWRARRKSGKSTP